MGTYAFTAPPGGCTPGSCSSPLEVDFAAQTVSVSSAPTATGHVANKAYVDASVAAIDTNDAGGARITNVAVPVASDDASNKAYVDGAVSAAGVEASPVCTTVKDNSCKEPGWRKVGESYYQDAQASGNGYVESCCYFPQSASSEPSYFVLSNGTWNANLGGIEGATVKCYEDLVANDWKGKNNVDLAIHKVRAFLCDGNSCFSPTPNTEYTFATSGDVNAGGDTLLIAASGK